MSDKMKLNSLSQWNSDRNLIIENMCQSPDNNLRKYVT